MDSAAASVATTHSGTGQTAARPSLPSWATHRGALRNASGGSTSECHSLSAVLGDQGDSIAEGLGATGNALCTSSTGAEMPRLRRVVSYCVAIMLGTCSH